MMRRYYCYGKDDLGCRYDAFSEPDPDGDWVDYDDHVAECQRMLAECQRAACRFVNDFLPVNWNDRQRQDVFDRLRAAMVSAA